MIITGWIIKLPILKLVYSIRFFFWILSFTILFNLFLSPGNVIFSIGSLNATQEGLKIGLYYTLRILTIIISAGIFAMTTSPEEFEEAVVFVFEEAVVFVLYPLKKIKFPLGEFTLILSLTLRFVPIITFETRRIILAQKLRGAKFNGNIIQRIKALSSVIIPLIYSLFKRVDEITFVMESRFVNPHMIVIDLRKPICKDIFNFSCSIIIIFMIFIIDNL
jgi:energy-coupling factor transport system permease protein